MENKKGPYYDEADAVALRSAILYLKSNQLIKRDSEIALVLNYTKGTVSEYINGKKRVSAAFRLKFEKKYNLQLSNFVLKSKLNLKEGKQFVQQLLLTVAANQERMIEINKELLQIANQSKNILKALQNI